VASKPFNINYIIPDAELDGASVLLNGDQISRISVKKTVLGWEVTFHMTDGSTYRVGHGEWATKFVKETFGKD